MDSQNDSSSFTQLTHKISSQIQEISKNVTSIQRMVGQLGTAQDSEQIRQKLHESQHYTNTLSHETMKLLKTLTNLPSPTDSTEQRQWKLQRDRLTNEFSTVLNNFQSSQRSADSTVVSSFIPLSSSAYYHSVFFCRRVLSTTVFAMCLCLEFLSGS